MREFELTDVVTINGFADRLRWLGLSPEVCEGFARRRAESMTRLETLRQRLESISGIGDIERLCVYVAGSHARGDASIHSDIDIWFLQDDVVSGDSQNAVNLKTINLMAAVIKHLAEMDAPEPSNDGEYLRILSLHEILEHLGGPQDDYKNHFTARMLLILESYPVYGASIYENALSEIIGSYMRDYEDHAEDFRPIFLVNDIIRYWKTLCLNYEHRRNQIGEAGKIKQKVRNFKLGYSRLLTCFAAVAVLSEMNHVTKEELIATCQKTPVERLLSLAERRHSTKDAVATALTSYHWFLKKTEMSNPDLHEYFSVRENRVIAFQHAKKFGDQIFDIVKLASEEAGTFRYLVV